MRRSCFRLAKWYADCITADGVVFVGYAARAHLGPVTIPYRSTLVNRPDTPSAAEFTVRPGPSPMLTDGRVTWCCPRLGVNGTWTGTAPVIQRVLYDDDRSLVDWHCHLPSASASVRVRDVAPLVGEGYVEELVIAGDPRRLPIRELWWGRFTGDGHYLVWIVWRGPHPLTVVFNDGQERSDGRASADGVAFAGGRLAYGATRTLRTGRIGRTFLAAHPGIARLVPRALDLHEQKWISRARLEQHGGLVAEGWAIHEVIRWP